MEEGLTDKVESHEFKEGTNVIHRIEKGKSESMVFNPSEVRLECDRAGMNDYVVKPVMAEALLAAL